MLEMKQTITLSDENYYSNEADWHYMSVSQYKSFLECEAATLAKLKNEWDPDSDKKPLLVGNYAHSYFESLVAHHHFKEENKDKLYSNRKPHGLLRDFQIAEQLINRLKNEQVFKQLYKGEKEVIVIGNLFGVTWKGRIDCLNLEQGYFVDIKTTQVVHEKKDNSHWRSQANFIKRYGYLIQMGIYRKLLRQKYNKDVVPIIAAVSKQTPSDAALIS